MTQLVRPLAYGLLLTLAIVACGQTPPAALSAPPTAVAPTAATNPAFEGSNPAAMAPVVEAPPPAAGPTTLFFSGLPQGAFPVHLHSACNAAQGYHLSVLAPLVVDGNGSGGISVPAADLAHGRCVIVYADSSLGRVLAERPL